MLTPLVLVVIFIALVAFGVWPTARRMWRAERGEAALLRRRRRVCRVYHRLRQARRIELPTIELYRRRE